MKFIKTACFLAVSAILCGCASQTEQATRCTTKTRETRSASDATTRWSLVNIADGFCFELPPDSFLIYNGGIDSLVMAYQREGMVISFDFGAGDRLRYDDWPDFRSSMIEVSGSPAKFVTFDWPVDNPYQTPGHPHVSAISFLPGRALSMKVERSHDDGENLAIAERILRSIRFAAE